LERHRGKLQRQNWHKQKQQARGGRRGGAADTRWVSGFRVCCVRALDVVFGSFVEKSQRQKQIKQARGSRRAGAADTRWVVIWVVGLGCSIHTGNSNNGKVVCQPLL
jgi:hypothetical protein